MNNATSAFHHLGQHLLRSPTCYLFQYRSRPLRLDVPERNILHERTPLDSWLEFLFQGVRSFYLIHNF